MANYSTFDCYPKYVRGRVSAHYAPVHSRLEHIKVSIRIGQQRKLHASGIRDTNGHGLLLRATSAIVGFFLSSLINYNFGDGEVALVFWWLMGAVVVLTRIEVADQSDVIETG